MMLGRGMIPIVIPERIFTLVGRQGILWAVIRMMNSGAIRMWKQQL